MVYEAPVVTEVGAAEDLIQGGGDFLLDASNQEHLD